MTNYLSRQMPRLRFLLAVLLPLASSLACSTDDKPAVKRIGLKPIDIREAAIGEGAADGGGDDGSTDGVDGGGTDSGSDDATANDSVSLYKRTAYPLLVKWCKSCHAEAQSPIFASADPVKAHDALIAGEKVNFQTPGQSRIVLREAKDNHNCPAEGCEAAAAALEAAVTEWKTHLEDQNTDIPALPSTATHIFRDAVVKKVDGGNPPGIIVIEAEKGTLKAPFAMADVATASGAKVVQTPAGAGSQNNVTTAAADNNLGTILYDFEVKEAGTYRINGLINAPTAANNAFWIKMDAGTLLGWQVTANAAAYTWDVADAVVAVGTPHQFILAAGPHRLEIRQREEQTKLDKLVIADDPMYNPATAGPTIRDVNVLSFDLAEQTGIEGAQLTIEVSDYSANAYKFLNPTLVLPSGQVKVRNLKLLINGIFLPQHATYTIVDKTVAAPGGVLTSAALVALKDKGLDMDEFSFVFEVLEAVK